MRSSRRLVSSPDRQPNRFVTAAWPLRTVFFWLLGVGEGPARLFSPMGSRLRVVGEATANPPGRQALGLCSDGVRDVPDVSLFAGAGFFGAFYVVCQQSINTEGKPCNDAAPNYDFAGYGGTSVAAPAFAGILSLINQKTGSRQGNANYVFYNLANQQKKAGTAVAESQEFRRLIVSSTTSRLTRLLCRALMALPTAL